MRTSNISTPPPIRSKYGSEFESSVLVPGVQRNSSNPWLTSKSMAVPNSGMEISRQAMSKLNYEVHSWSSHAPPYHPSAILENDPSNQGSRWTTSSNNQNQYLILRLDKPAVLTSITLGKYYKVHVCNLKEFKVFVSAGCSDAAACAAGEAKGNPDAAEWGWCEALHAGLRNDSEMETFSIRYKFGDVILPTQFIKIVPLVPWGPNFKFSIWYLEMKGVASPDVVEQVYSNYVHFREHHALRLILKHLRQRALINPFECLSTTTQVVLEDPLLTQLHRALVMDGDFDQVEQMIIQAGHGGLLNEWARDSGEWLVQWTKLGPHPSGSMNAIEGFSNNQNAEEWPSPRGGHQLVIDSNGGKLYLFGGWDGNKDLGDLWEFTIDTRKWRCISTDTRRQGGPSPRSCHKCVWDGTGGIYVLGRYLDNDVRPSAGLDNDFWFYDTINNKWTKLSAHTAAEGGPELIYDHQMVMDIDNGVLYVYGGKAIDVESNNGNPRYSGLYAYDVKMRRWTCMLGEIGGKEGEVQLRSRIGHSMLLNPTTQELYIFAGQRNKDYLADFYAYHIPTGTVTEISRDYSKTGGPDAGFTQRATVDCELGEIYVMNGLIRERGGESESVRNAVWVYNLRKDKWNNVYANDNSGTDYWASQGNVEPCPRFAHQLVYDVKRRVHFLHGGNPGERASSNARLDDLWMLAIGRQTSDEGVRRGRFAIRKQRFRELCHTAQPAVALKYLQTELSSVVNHNDEAASREFRELTGWLFRWGNQVRSGTNISPNGSGSFAGNGMGMVGTGPESTTSYDPYAHRMELYAYLVSFFPEQMREPRGNLVDIL